MPENIPAAPQAAQAAGTTVSPQQPVEEKDIQERIEGFNKELLPLLGKYELGLAAMPKIVPDGRVFADPIVVSVRNRTDVPKPTDVPAAAPAAAEPAGATASGLATGE